MAKDREGVFHPRKGKPSGTGKAKASELQVDIKHIEENFSLEDKYIEGVTNGVEDIAANVRVRHPNRNVDKGEFQHIKRDNTPNKTLGDTEAYEETQIEELPSLLTKEVFSSLANYTSACCISIYIPIDNKQMSDTENDQVSITTFKNLLQKSESLMKSRGIGQEAIDRILKPGYDSITNQQFWNQLTNGLAVFIADGFFKYSNMPVLPTEEVFINSSFFVSPLIPIMASKQHFFLLVLSKKKAKLFKGDSFGMEYITSPEMPEGVDDVVHFENKDDEKLMRTGGGGEGGANFHGMGGGKPDEKTHVGIYLQEVDTTIWKEILHNENAPLLLAGVEYLIPIYKEVSKYKNIWPDAITGNHVNDDTNLLYSAAMEKIKPYFEERTVKALASFGNHSASTLTSTNPADVIPAAYYAKVAHLFVQMNEHIWGSFDEQNNELVIHQSQQQDDECLVDKSIAKVILNGGEVHILDKEQMPEGSKLAALMRY